MRPAGLNYVGGAWVEASGGETYPKQSPMRPAETTGVFTETAGGVTTAVLAKLAERGDIDPDERVVIVITGEGLKTLDAVRGTFEAFEISPSFDQFVADVEGAEVRV